MTDYSYSILLVRLNVKSNYANKETTSVTSLHDFWKLLTTNLLTKVAQKDCSLLGYFEKYQLM